MKGATTYRPVGSILFYRYASYLVMHTALRELKIKRMKARSAGNKPETKVH